MDIKNKKTLPVGSRPVPPGIPNPTCPVLLEAKGVLDKARELHRVLGKLRQSTQRCTACPERAECATLSYYAKALDTAMRELRQEWGLDHE